MSRKVTFVKCPVNGQCVTDKYCRTCWNGNPCASSKDGMPCVEGVTEYYEEWRCAFLSFFGELRN